MIKKIHMILPLSLLMFAGCGSRNKKTVQQHNHDENGLSDNVQEQRHSIFDEHEEAFVLEETANPFASEDGAIQLTEVGPLWESAEQENFETIYFAFDQYKIAPEQRVALERNVTHVKSILAQGDGAQVVIEGHACDSAGSPRYNVELSDHRAREVKKFFVERGLPADKLKVVGRGSEMRKVQGGTREQQAPNRRVEFYIVREVAAK